MKLGLGSYTYGWAISVREHEPAQLLDEQGLLDRCHEHGVRLLQIGDNLPLHTFDRARLRRLAERAAKEDVCLEVGARRLTAERVSEYASVARQIGARLIRFVIDDAGYHPTPEAVIATLRKAVPLLDDLTLALENHDRFSARRLRHIVEAVGHHRLGICLDTANSLGAGEGLETVLRELAPLTVNLHIKDFAITRLPHRMGFTVEGRPAGRGMLDIPGLIRTLAPYGRCETGVLELWTPPEASVEDTIAREAAWAKMSVDFLRPFFTPPMLAESQP